MKTLILAAGRGKRLGELTLDKPKCLLKIGQKTILEMAIENCLHYGLDDFLIVTGHKNETIGLELERFGENRPFKYDSVFNPCHDRMENCYSLYLGLEKITDEDVLILNSDVVFDKNMLKGILEIERSSILADCGKKLGEEEMKIIVKDNRLKDIGKKLDPEKSQGEYTGISKIKKTDLDIFKGLLLKAAEENPAYYYDEIFKRLSEKADLAICDTLGLDWTEVDTVEDLNYAKEIF